MASFYVHILPWTLVCKRKETKRSKTKRTETGYVLKWNETQRHDRQKRQTNATLITVLPNETERFWSRFFDAYCTLYVFVRNVRLCVQNLRRLSNSLESQRERTRDSNLWRQISDDKYRHFWRNVKRPEGVWSARHMISHMTSVVTTSPALPKSYLNIWSLSSKFVCKSIAWKLMVVGLSPTRGNQFFFEKWLVLGELCCVA